MKAGLEVHQQLATGKLFCACPSELSESVRGSLVRRLKSTGGENHAIDPAVAFEAARGLTFRYQATDSDCLVEADEEPPHALNPAALEVALTVAALFHARPLDEVQVMRKIVIDGSNTSGFQRTALVAVDGELTVDGRTVSIPTISLEEDAARRVGLREGEPEFRLDRLGIPLIEIATGPEIEDGKGARAVAEEIGALVRATRRVRRGIGTIREDLNVSVPGGTRIEIKGVQELRLIEKYVQYEESRQLHLLRIRELLRTRNPPPPPATPIELGPLLEGLTSGPFRSVRPDGPVALGLLLPGFGGMLGNPDPEKDRLGRELADRARAIGLKGLVHSDELPGYGVEGARLERLRSELAAGPEDGFVIVAAPTAELGARAIAAVRERALAAFEGVPPETRDPLPDGRTRYSRPLPGRDRMYPETDVPPVPIGAPAWTRATENLPELPGATRRRLAAAHGLHLQALQELERADAIAEFESLVGRGHAPAAVARLLTRDVDEARAGLDPVRHEPTVEELDQVLAAWAAGRFAKEATPTVLRTLLSDGPPVDAAIAAAAIEPLSRPDLDRMVAELLDRNAPLLRDKGERALSPLMGDLMAQVRGRRDGQEVAAALRTALKLRLAGATVAGA
ncbi:MAG TPA: Glu-tRNA(Gln) amidotransferase subunit GatE [Thermoplasmata archaeon]|nr:Glu-tRNA(Gln) amidotransferase subunit GatE [Thermoplasmata archaeon]